MPISRAPRFELMTTRTRTRLIAGFTLAVSLFFAALAANPARAADAPMNIVATVGMVGDAVSRVAGDYARVTALMGPGVDPHSYRQTRSDVVKLGQADAIFSNGLYLEAQLHDLLDQLSQKKPVIRVGDQLPAYVLLNFAGYKDRFDPHVWMDVGMWARVVETVRDGLIGIDPPGEADYRRNADAYLAEIRDLDAYVRKVAETVPEEKRVVVTAHDAFSYFGRAYGFEVVGIQGISTQSEAGLRRIEEIVSLIVDKGIKAVFVESSVSERNVRALVEGAAARGHEIVVGGQLYSDAMGTPGTYEGTYLGMLDHNATLIARALGGTAPETGRLGRLGTGS